MSLWTSIRNAVTKPFKEIGKFFYNKGGKDYSRTFYYSRDYIAKGTRLHYKDNFSFEFKGTTTALVFGYFGTTSLDAQKAEIEQTLKDLENNLFNPLKKIDTQYQLGLSYSEIYNMIYYYSSKMDGKVSVNPSVVLGMITSLYTGGLSGALGLVATWYKGSNDMYLRTQASTINYERSTLKNKITSLAIKSNKDEIKHIQSDRLTKMIIKDGYSIYANGNYFLTGGAGSNSYASQNAYDNSKGIYGNDIGTEESKNFDDMVNFRNGKIGAGGVNFYNQMIFEDDVVQNVDNFNFIGSYYIQWKRIVLRINDGITKLNEVKGLINGFKDDSYLTANGKLDEIYKRIIKDQTTQKKRQITNDMFLEQMKNYSRGLAPQFSFVNELREAKSSNNKIHTTPTPEQDNRKADTYEELMDGKDFRDIEKITAYIYEIQKKLKKVYDLSDTRHIFVNSGETLTAKIENGEVVLAGNLSNYDFMGGIFKGASISMLEIKRLYIEEFLPNLTKTKIYKDEVVIGECSLKISDESYIYLTEAEFYELKAAIYLPQTLESSEDWEFFSYQMNFSVEIEL